MKQYNLYKKTGLAAGLFAMVAFSSCIKNYRDGETNFNNLQPVVLIPEGGLAAFGAQALSLNAADETDTIYFRLNYAATNVAPADEKISIAVNGDALTAYNSNNPVQYQLFPDSIFSFTTTDVTIKAGQSYSDPIPVAVHPSKVDPSKNYMLPISIKSAPSGAIISSNFGTVYFHLIGNPVAGTYNGTGTRTSYSGVISYTYPGPLPAGGAPTDLAPSFPKVAAPDDSHTVEIPYANLAGLNYSYVITMDDNLNIVSVDRNNAFATTTSNWIVYAATYDKATKTFHLVTHYNNAADGTGKDRIVEETMTHQ